MRFSVFSSTLLLVTLFCFSGVSLAEFACRADTTYMWTKQPPAPPTPMPMMGQKVTPTPTPAKPETLTVFWVTSEAMGEDEMKAKDALSRKLESERARARDACKREHENAAFCIGSKLSAMKSVLRQLDFEARRSLQESVATDCAAQHGTCGAISSSDPVCRDLAPPAEGEGDGEDGKKKKK